MVSSKDKLAFGWGVADAEYTITQKEDLPILNGKRRQKVLWICPYYSRWRNMLRRCFDSKYHKNQPTYKGCTVHEGWKYLSNFIKWVDSQPNRDWENCHLDKDFLVEGNKHYSPDTCVYVPKSLNSLSHPDTKQEVIIH